MRRDNASGPKHWANETTGVLRPVVEAYLRGEPLNATQVAVMRIYLQHWISADWGNLDVDELRQAAKRIATRTDVVKWLNMAVALGLDPL
jgi:hypothetical protein